MTLLPTKTALKILINTLVANKLIELYSSNPSTESTPEIVMIKGSLLTTWGTIYNAPGLTPKGMQRLYELEHPIICWSQKNWFPLLVALATTSASIIVPIAIVIINKLNI